MSRKFAMLETGYAKKFEIKDYYIDENRITIDFGNFENPFIPISGYLYYKDNIGDDYEYELKVNIDKLDWIEIYDGSKTISCNNRILDNDSILDFNKNCIMFFREIDEKYPKVNVQKPIKIPEDVSLEQLLDIVNKYNKSL